MHRILHNLALQLNLIDQNGKNPGFTSLYSNLRGVEISHVKRLYMAHATLFSNSTPS